MSVILYIISGSLEVRDELRKGPFFLNIKFSDFKGTFYYARNYSRNRYGSQGDRVFGFFTVYDTYTRLVYIN